MTQYYVSSVGSNSNNGLSTSSTWATQAKVVGMSSALSAGDTVSYRRGDTFFGAFSILGANKSGTVGNPITFNAYGTGAKPVFTGFRPVPSWSIVGTNLWESTASVSALSTMRMVKIDGVNRARARWPKVGSVLTINGSVTNGIRSAGLTTSSVLDWTGGQIAVQDSAFTMAYRTISSQIGSLITYSGTDLDLGGNKGFFIQDSIQAVTRANDWYYNTSTKKITVFSPVDPAAATLQGVSNFTGLSTITLTP